jgi:apolipoprotein D and lipocalin family protein
MRSFTLTALIYLFMPSVTAQNVTTVNLDKYSGKWFILASIPTKFDKNWEYVTESYALNPNGRIDIFTTYKKPGSTKEKHVRSKGFPNRKKNNVCWKVQFVWPFKADYLIEELADDYSYVVVGHPKHKFLYIMNRSGKMSEAKYNMLVERCHQKGYPVSELHKVKQ